MDKRMTEQLVLDGLEAVIWNESPFAREIKSCFKA